MIRIGRIFQIFDDVITDDDGISIVSGFRRLSRVEIWLIRKCQLDKISPKSADTIKATLTGKNLSIVFLSDFTMKLIVLALATLAISLTSASTDEWEEIDWSTVIPRTEAPGFWDDRVIRPAFYPGDQTRTGRIVGGAIVTPHTHPYQAGLLQRVNILITTLCGGSIITPRTILTAAHW